MNAELTTTVRRRVVPRESVVGEFVALERLHTRDFSLLEHAARGAVCNVSRLTGPDLSSILKASVRLEYRNELLLAAVCESLKTLSIGTRELASILDSFAKLNFVPSDSVLRVLASQTKRGIELKRTRLKDVCVLFRYWSIVRVDGPLVHTLDNYISENIGKMGPVEISIVAKYYSGSFEELVSNFYRNDNITENVRMYFERNLRERFGYSCESEPKPLVDSTGWNGIANIYNSSELPVHNSQKQSKAKFPRFQLDDQLVNELLQLKTQKVQTRQTPKSNTPTTQSEWAMDPEQLKALVALTDETQPVPKTYKMYTDKIPQRLRRVNETRDFLSKGLSRNYRRIRQYKAARNRTLYKFSLLAAPTI